MRSVSSVKRPLAFPPLGLLTAASLLPADWSKRLVDLNVENIKDKDLAWADMVFIGGMAVQRESARQTIARCKAAGLAVVAGGPLFTSEPDEFKQVDYLVLDKAELTLPVFLSDLKTGQPKRIYRAPGFWDLGETPPVGSVIRKERLSIKDLINDR